MYWLPVKIAISAGVIAFASWLSNKRPELAGFIVALPLGTLLVLAFSYAEYKNPETAVKFAQSIFAAIPVSLLFFIPFLLAKKLPVGFWGLYAIGIALLVAGYFAHSFIMEKIG
jgi:hypothetical protein